MLPFAPSLHVRPFTPDEWETAGTAINALVLAAPYSAALDAAALREQLFGAEPPTILPTRWTQRQLLGAWRAGELLGVIDIGAGFDSDSLLVGAAQPVGLLRFLVLPLREDLVNATAAALLAAAGEFWRECGVGVVKAYHFSTGYPTLQGGAGLLPGDWSDQVRLLTEHGFRFADRYYLLVRPSGAMIEETVPQGGLSLAFRGEADDRRYQVFFRRTELIAEARLIQRPVQVETGVRLFGCMAHWDVDERWRNQKIGRWLLRRMINDTTQQGLADLAVYLLPQQAAAMNLLGQHGFIELNYRGYSFEKELAE